MKCPHCASKVPEAAERCPVCGFALASLRVILGSHWVRLERITDTSSCLRLEDTRRLLGMLDDFERQFPQCFFGVYLGPVPTGLNPAELGFWLLNHGAFNTHEVTKRNDFGIMTIIDPVHQTAGISVGYALEKVVPESALAKILGRLETRLNRHAYAEALEMALAACRQLLLKRARKQRRQFDSISAVGQSPADLGFQPLRAGHRSPARGAVPVVDTPWQMSP